MFDIWKFNVKFIGCNCINYLIIDTVTAWYSNGSSDCGDAFFLVFFLQPDSYTFHLDDKFCFVYFLVFNNHVMMWCVMHVLVTMAVTWEHLSITMSIMMWYVMVMMADTWKHLSITMSIMMPGQYVFSYPPRFVQSYCKDLVRPDLLKEDLVWEAIEKGKNNVQNHFGTNMPQQIQRNACPSMLQQFLNVWEQFGR